MDVVSQICRVSALLACALAIGCGSSINEHLLMAKRGDDEQVQEALVSIGQDLEARQTAGFDLNEGELQAVAFLQEVALAHQNSICRMIAITELAALRETGSEKIFITCLDDPHFGIRQDAAKALIEHPTPEATEELSKRVREETNIMVLTPLIKALGKIGTREALEILLEVFLDKNSRYQNSKLKAYDMVREISGRNYAYENQQAWKAYYEREFPPTEAAPPSRSLTSPTGSATDGSAETSEKASETKVEIGAGDSTESSKLPLETTEEPEPAPSEATPDSRAETRPEPEGGGRPKPETPDSTGAETTDSGKTGTAEEGGDL